MNYYQSTYNFPDFLTRCIVPVLLLVVLIVPVSFSQDYCDDSFTDNSFADIQKITMQYGRAVEPTGYVDSVNLFLDLYFSPENTREIQPMMILMHGGSFITELGDRSGMEEIARLMVSKGFVVASISYRTWSYLLGGAPSVDGIVDVVVKAMHDLQAAIEFVVAQNGKGEFPAVDVQNLVLGGGSAGAITVLHRLYIDADDELPEFLATAFENNGGLFETQSDDYHISFGINLSGGIYDTAWIDAGETPLISVHGDLDDVVFYDHGLSQGFIELYGSKPINERLIEQDVESYLYTFEGGGHSDIYEDIPIFRDPLLQVLDTGLVRIQDLFCLRTNVNLKVILADVKLINTIVLGDMIIQNKEVRKMNYDVVDLWGRNIQSGMVMPGVQRIRFHARTPGYYALRVYDADDGGWTRYQQLFYFK